MPYVLGIDIGTSFTTAAVANIDEGRNVAAPEVLRLGSHGAVVPSVIYLDDNGHVLIGDAARRRGMDRPDRVLRDFKRRVGDTVPIVAAGVSIAPEHVFATMARWVVDRAEEHEGAPPVAVMLTHPANWGGYKLALVREALAGVGLADVMVLSEPGAAARHYDSQERVNSGSTVAVYDFGGDRFDIAIVTKRDSGAFAALCRPAEIERLGGADFDDAVFAHVTASVGDDFPQPEAGDREAMIALSRVRSECVEAKEALSSDAEVSIPVVLPGMQTQVRLVRGEFESMIDASLRETIHVLKNVVQARGLDVDDLAAILLTGGSSRIPLVAELLSDELNRPIVIDADPKATIALGAALAAATALLAERNTDVVPATSAVPGTGTDAASEPVEGEPTTPTQPHRSPVRARLAAVTVAAFTAALLGTVAVLQTSDLTALIAQSTAGGSGVERSDLPTRQFLKDHTAPGTRVGPDLREPSNADPAPLVAPPSARSTANRAPDNYRPHSGADSTSPIRTSPELTSSRQPGQDPVPTSDPTPSPTSSPAPDPASSPTPTPIPSPSPTPSTNPTTSPSPTPSPSPTADPTPSPSPTGDPTPVPTAPSADPTPTPSAAQQLAASLD
ncbi:Hsp70 family protein [Parafrigoribacterium mesophilum]|uniref:Hsp70 family protein n=1 Tax=Parafrigoribacterium mesophilum TaxID=433646 RepID=UPI0031FD8F11